MRNTRVGFLGDPNFPTYGLQGTKGADIMFYQDLYEEYSKKSFMNIEDRPFAISGLEQRLSKALNAKNNSSRGYWGIVDEYWARGLLWRRADGVEKMIRLTRGPAGVPLPAPSWSWEGYSGAINYLKLSGSRTGMTTASYQGDRHLKGIAKDFYLPENEEVDDVNRDIVFDDPATRSLRGPLKVVVIGNLKVEGVPREDVRNFVLVLAKKTPARDDLYERVGAVSFTGR
jgi:hypothetical protein